MNAVTEEERTAMLAAGAVLDNEGNVDAQRSDLRTLPSGVISNDIVAAVKVFNAQSAAATTAQQLRNWLDFQTALCFASRGPNAPTDWAYSCTYDLVASAGRPYTPRLLPRGVKWGAKKQCFHNAFVLASRHPGLTYVEGYGLTETGIPVHHAWTQDTDGNPVDNTWRLTDHPYATHLRVDRVAYIGVPIPTDLLWSVATKRRYNGILEDYEHDYPAFWRAWDPAALKAVYDAFPAPAPEKRVRRNRA